MIAIIGSGPAGLMAAETLSKANKKVILFEKRKSPGRKLLVAGSSGLNITHELPHQDFIKIYKGGGLELWNHLLKSFSPQDWVRYIEDLSVKTFLGTSKRYFIEDKKAATFLKKWTDHLKNQGVQFQLSSESTDFKINPISKKITLSFKDQSEKEFDAVCFALGGGSWEPDEKPLRWLKIFQNKNIKITEFAPSNVGYQVHWPKKLIEEVDRSPLKRIMMSSSKGQKAGDLLITSYGLEGTPVYFVGTTETVTLDLRPDLSESQITSRLKLIKENLSPIRRIKKQLQLCPAALAIFFHMTPPELLKTISLSAIAKRIKHFPLKLESPQPLEEAISSTGGIELSELNQNLMLKSYPGVFVAGEMLNWDAPTGGFLIQACVSQGVVAGNGILEFLETQTESYDFRNVNKKI